MLKKNQEELKTNWLNAVRFFAVLYVLWTHYEYEIFAEVHPLGQNIEKLFFMPPSPSSWLLYGYTGKYAVAVLCVISGFVTAYSLNHKNKTSVVYYFVTRYLRIMLPVVGICLFTLAFLFIRDGMVYYDIAYIVKGMFLPGSKNFYGYFWCLSSFLIGNYLIFILHHLLKKASVKARLSILGVFIVLNYCVWYKLYIWDLVWAISVLTGYWIYEFVQNYKLFLPYGIRIFSLLVVWWLPRGDESLKIYIRDTVAVCIIITLLLNSRVVNRLNNISNQKIPAKIFGYSYSLYVVHGFSMNYFAIDLTIGLQNVFNQWWITYIISFLIKTLFDFGFAVMLNCLFEKLIYKKCCRILKQMIK